MNRSDLTRQYTIWETALIDAQLRGDTKAQKHCSSEIKRYSKLISDAHESEMKAEREVNDLSLAPQYLKEGRWFLLHEALRFVDLELSKTAYWLHSHKGFCGTASYWEAIEMLQFGVAAMFPRGVAA